MKGTIYFTLLLGLLVTDLANAQSVRKSQKGTVSQQIAQTMISIEYHRPVARGRVLFGDEGIVNYDKVWMPGANEATTIEFSEDVSINGSELKKGKYSVWTIPGETEWTVIFSNQWDAWHSRYPEGEDELRITAIPEEGVHMEVLAFYFPEVTEDSAILRFHWGSTVIPLVIRL
ncbi:MAG: DUF2911 domain-containing protein [Balneola sp.]|nr:MAG: DUF2911 domain-containing protein [Balneola sp.]